ncbi:MAG: hypothetical protein K0R66_855 [Gammaproteobacteria bacterium]|jgi:DNA repair exonuclease SbcCD ATPase subunit|nr:hypothetical protein [Gammaproteobacteria bacterium]
MAFAKLHFERLEEEASSQNPYSVTMTKTGGISVVIPPGEMETPHAKAIEALCAHLASAAAQLRKRDATLEAKTEKISELTRRIAELTIANDNLQELNKRLLSKLEEQRAAAARERKRQLELAQTKLETEQNRSHEAVQIARKFAREKTEAIAELRESKAASEAANARIHQYNEEINHIRERLLVLEESIAFLERDNKKIRDQLREYQNHAKIVTCFNPHLLHGLPADLKAELSSITGQAPKP